jgi:hypothetical protein
MPRGAIPRCMGSMLREPGTDFHEFTIPEHLGSMVDKVSGSSTATICEDKECLDMISELDGLVPAMAVVMFETSVKHLKHPQHLLQQKWDSAKIRLFVLSCFHVSLQLHGLYLVVMGTRDLALPAS